MLSIPMSTELVRLESDFYTAKTFVLQTFLSGEEIIDFVQYGTSEELNEQYLGYPILRLNEFNSSFIGLPSKYCKTIDSNTFESLKLLKDDVLICRTNGNPKYVGKSALVPQNYEFAYASYLFKIRPKKEIINASTLVAYLNSKYGRMEIEKFSMTSNQSNFSPAKFRELRIPIFSKSLLNLIEKIYYSSFNFLMQSEIKYSESEEILLEEIGLKNFEPSKEPINIKSFKDSFGSTGRLDAEYYLKKYEDYLKLIFNYKSGFERLEIACQLKDNNFSPFENTSYKYIELSNIGKTGEVNGCSEELGIDLPTRARRLVSTGDVIISSIEGSLQSCAIISKKYNYALCSTGFYVIKSNKINSETLLVLFKSEPMQAIMKQNCSGTILTGMNKDEFSNIPIPIIDYKIQKQIAELIEESFKLKAESEKLLEVAKQAVEIAIEINEETAMKFIKKKGK